MIMQHSLQCHFSSIKKPRCCTQRSFLFFFQLLHIIPYHTIPYPPPLSPSYPSLIPHLETPHPPSPSLPPFHYPPITTSPSFATSTPKSTPLLNSTPLHQLHPQPLAAQVQLPHQSHPVPSPPLSSQRPYQRIVSTLAPTGQSTLSSKREY